MTKLLVEVYARKDCSLCTLAMKAGCAMCKEARDVISRVKEDIPFQYKEVDIKINDELFRIYKEAIPTVFINGKKSFKFKVDEVEFRKRVRKEIIRAGIMRLGTKKQHYS